MATDIITTYEEAESILDEIDKAFFDIPFGNSAYQTETFVLAAAITPERAFRAIGLEMSDKIRSLREAKFKQKEFEIDRDEAAAKLESGELSEFDQRREQLKMERAEAELPFTKKLINDALVELNLLYKHFKALPKFTREQFEAGEQMHYIERLARQHHLSGNQLSLYNIEHDLDALLKYEAVTECIESADSETLAQLREQLPNVKANAQEDDTKDSQVTLVKSAPAN